MADTTFISKVTGFVVSWAQAVNDFIYKGRNPNYVLSTGGSNVYNIALPAGSLYSSSADGDTFTFKAHQGNNGAATAIITGAASVGPFAIQFQGSALVGGEIATNGSYTLIKQGSVWNLLGGSSNFINRTSSSQTISSSGSTNLEVLTIAHTNPGSLEAPIFSLYRNSASPAVADDMGSLVFQGNDSSLSKTTYAAIKCPIESPTAPTPSGILNFWTTRLGGVSIKATLADGLQLLAAGVVPTGGDKGAGTLNVAGTIWANGSQIADTSGRLLTSSYVRFPSVQVPSAGANDLDDYVEKTSWTPTLTSGSPGDLAVTYSERLGLYGKVGNLVFLNFRIVTSSFTYTTATGALVINGIPFPSLAGSVSFPGALSFSGWTHAGYTTLVAFIDANTSQVKVAACGTGVATGTEVVTTFPSGGNVVLIGSVIYQTA